MYSVHVLSSGLKQDTGWDQKPDNKLACASVEGHSNSLSMSIQ